MLRLFNRRDPMAGSIRDTRAEELEAEIALLLAENDRLRAALADRDGELALAIAANAAMQRHREEPR